MHVRLPPVRLHSSRQLSPEESSARLACNHHALHPRFLLHSCAAISPPLLFSPDSTTYPFPCPPSLLHFSPIASSLVLSRPPVYPIYIPTTSLILQHTQRQLVCPPAPQPPPRKVTMRVPLLALLLSSLPAAAAAHLHRARHYHAHPRASAPINPWPSALASLLALEEILAADADAALSGVLPGLPVVMTPTTTPAPTTTPTTTATATPTWTTTGAGMSISPSVETDYGPSATGSGPRRDGGWVTAGRAGTTGRA